MERSAESAKRQEFLSVQGNGMGLSCLIPIAENLPSEVQMNHHPYYYRTVGTTERERHTGVHRPSVQGNERAAALHPDYRQP